MLSKESDNQINDQYTCPKCGAPLEPDYDVYRDTEIWTCRDCDYEEDR